MRHASPRQGRRREDGFTLFEMVVVICSIAILYMVAEQRINDLPAAAERASFQAVLDQIRTGVNLAMIGRLGGRRGGDARQLAGTNPMDLMLEEPVNYLGEMDEVTDRVRRRNAWYYEVSSGELVYMVGGNSIDDVWIIMAGVPVNLGQLRFRIENLYDDGRGGLVHGSRSLDYPTTSDWEGVQLVPVYEYRWERRGEAELNGQIAADSL